jgi:hypothetical protein
MYADRAQASVRWVQNDIYGDILGISQRADVIKANDEAGFFLSFTGSAQEDNAGA